MPRQLSLKNLPLFEDTLLKLGRLFDREKGTCYLTTFSSSLKPESSYLCLFPYEIISIKASFQQRTNLETRWMKSVSQEDSWQGLKALLPEPLLDHPFPEWVGFLSFLKEGSVKLDRAYLQRSAVVIAFHHAKEEATVIIADQGPYLLDERKREWVERFGNPYEWKELLNYLKEMDLLDSSSNVPPLKRTDNSEGLSDPFPLFCSLHKKHPPPLLAFLYLTSGTIISLSPEKFTREKTDFFKTSPPENVVDAMQASFFKLRTSPISEAGSIMGYISGKGDFEFNLASFAKGVKSKVDPIDRELIDASF